MVVEEGNIASLRRLRAFVNEWTRTGVRHEGATAFAEQLHHNLSGSPAGNLEHSGTFTPAGGGPGRPVTLRICDVRRIEGRWSACVEVSGLGGPMRERVDAETWPQAIERAAQRIAAVCALHPGTFDPPLFGPGPGAK